MGQEPNSGAEGKTKEKTQLQKELEKEQQKLDLELKKLETEQTKQAIRELKKPEEVKLPSTDTKGLKGTVTVEKGAGYYAEILAYEAMEICAEGIAEDLKSKLSDSAADTTGQLIIVGKVVSAEEVALWNLLKFKLDNVTEALAESIKNFPNRGKKFDLIKGESALATLTAAPAILGAAADIASFFKTNRVITARSVTINEQALISAVAKKIKTGNTSIEIILPELNLTGEGKLLTEIKGLMKKRDTLLAIKEVLDGRYEEKVKISSKELTKLKAKKSALIKKRDKAIADGNEKELNRELQQIELDIKNAGIFERNRLKIITRLDKEITAADDLIAACTEKTADNLSPLERVTTMEQIKKTSNAKILYVVTVSQGGEIEISQNIFTQGRVSYLGGSIISYFLTGIDGKYLSSGNEQKVLTNTFKRKKGTVSLKKAKLLKKEEKVEDEI